MKNNTRVYIVRSEYFGIIGVAASEAIAAKMIWDDFSSRHRLWREYYEEKLEQRTSSMNKEDWEKWIIARPFRASILLDYQITSFELKSDF